MKHAKENLYDRTNHQQVQRSRSVDQSRQIVPAAIRAIGVTEQTYYRWRKAYRGPKIDQAQRLRELEQENNRLKRLVADLSLDNAITKEALRGCCRDSQPGQASQGGEGGAGNLQPF